MGKKHNDKIKSVFNETIESDNKYNGNIKEINFYNIFCKAASDDNLYKIYDNNFCMFNYYYHDIESILMIFAIPVNLEGDCGVKQMAERVMKIVKKLEDIFIKIDFLNATEVVEDKFIYVVAVKHIEKANEEIKKEI